MGSPVINVGDATCIGINAGDQLRNPRIVGPAPDIGAVEYQNHTGGPGGNYTGGPGGNNTDGPGDGKPPLGTPTLQAMNNLTFAGCVGDRSVRNVLLTVRAGSQTMVKNAKGDVATYGAPRGFGIEITNSTSGGDWSTVPRRCHFSLGKTGSDAVRSMIKHNGCRPCFKCLKALGFRCAQATPCPSACAPTQGPAPPILSARGRSR